MMVFHFRTIGYTFRSLRRCSVFFLRIERRAEVAFYGLLGVVVVVAEALGTLVGGDGTCAVAFGVVGIAHLDV